MKYKEGDLVWYREKPNKLFKVKRQIGVGIKGSPLYILAQVYSSFLCIGDETQIILYEDDETFNKRLI